MRDPNTLQNNLARSTTNLLTTIGKAIEFDHKDRPTIKEQFDGFFNFLYLIRDIAQVGADLDFCLKGRA